MAEDHIASLAIRLARPADLPALIAIFAADDVGGHGDTNDPDALPAYQAAFNRIAANPFDTLYVAELDGVVVGTFQTTLGTSLASRGASYLTIGAVQTRAEKRGLGIGAGMMRYAIERGRDAGRKLHQADFEQRSGRRTPLLQAARLQAEPCRVQDEAPGLAIERASSSAIRPM